jgi:type IV pilus assembly protein PilO
MNRGIFTKLNLHFFVLAVVVAVDVFIGVRLALAWRAMRSNQTAAFVQEEARLEQLKAQMLHLNGLPKKVDAADSDEQKFYDDRIAPNYSTILAQLGAVATKSQVRLSRAAYAQNPATGGLTELHIDAGLSGQYSDLMHFINGIERDQDHVFFIIDGVTLNGQQGGLVNLRLRLTTYIRAGATDLPQEIDEPALEPAPNPGEEPGKDEQQQPDQPHGGNEEPQ